MSGVIIVDESHSFFGGLYSQWSHRNSTIYRDHDGNIGLSHSDLWFIAICSALLLLIVFFLIRLIYHAVKKCYFKGYGIKQAFIDGGRTRLEDEESNVGDYDEHQMREKDKFDNLAFFVESDYNHMIHKTIATGH